MHPLDRGEQPPSLGAEELADPRDDNKHSETVDVQPSEILFDFRRVDGVQNRSQEYGRDYDSNCKGRYFFVGHVTFTDSRLYFIPDGFKARRRPGGPAGSFHAG